MNHHPIGIFDSGVGGTSIWRELQKLLPFESTIYLADSKNAPYGEKSGKEIIALSEKNVDWLLERDCKMIIVACNTATTNAIDYLRSHYTVPFIGIEPAIKPAALNSRTGKVGVLATSGTLGSELFLTTSKTHAEDILILEQVGEGLVKLIEAGKVDTPEMRTLLASYLEPMIQSGIDQLVLGCTHYPYLIPLLKELLPAQVKIVDCGEAVARQAYSVLKEKELLSNSEKQGDYRFYINTDTSVLEKFLSADNFPLHIEQKDF
ncbi:MAG: glutamate racemase [Flavobacteriaceae bacterium]